VEEQETPCEEEADDEEELFPSTGNANRSHESNSDSSSGDMNRISGSILSGVTKGMGV